jgi:hypothetical protein
MQLSEAIPPLRECIHTALRGRDARLLEDYPLDRYMRCLDAFPVMAFRTYLSPEVRRQDEEIERRVASTGLELYHQLLLLALIERSAGRLEASDLSDDLRTLYVANYQRMVRAMERHSHAVGFYRFPRVTNEIGLAAMRFIPVGTQIIYLYRLPRRLFWTPPPRQIVAWTWLVARVGGLSGFYDMHTHSDDTRAMLEFNEVGARRLYHRVAELLRRNPQVKGITGHSWLNDPELERVSPELVYNSRIVTDNGGYSFCLGPCGADGIRDATLLSAKRRSLFEEGTYVPKNYLTVWLRKELIAWSERNQ